MVLDSKRWRCVEAVPPIMFSVEGLSAVRGREPGRRGWLTVAEGCVEAVREHHVVLEDDVSLAYVLPPRIDLRALVGSYVRLALNDEPADIGPRAQMLTISDSSGNLRLLARFGTAGQTHALGSTRIRTALSQRQDGPMAVGTDQLQYIVHVGERVRLRVPSGKFVVHYMARTAYDYVAYVIAEQVLWVSGKR
jgi:hypothetical protein